MLKFQGAGFLDPSTDSRTIKNTTQMTNCNSITVNAAAYHATPHGISLHIAEIATIFNPQLIEVISHATQ